MKIKTAIISIATFLITGAMLELLSISLRFYTGIILFIFYLSLSLLLWTNTVSFFTIVFFTLVLEAVGVATSIPFGHYIYGTVVAFPSIMNIPLFIPLAWYVLISAAAQLFPKWYFAGFFIVLLDIILEHSASVSGLWSWPGHTGLLTAPIQNYLTWGIVTSIGYFLIPKNKQLRSISFAILSLLISYMVLVSVIHELK